MIVRTKHYGISKVVTSQKDGKDYEIHLFEDAQGRFYEIAIEEGTFQPKSEYLINSYKGKDGFWKASLVNIR